MTDDWNRTRDGRNHWTRRTVLRFCSFGIAGLGGCVGGNGDPQNAPETESTDTTATTAKQGTNGAQTAAGGAETTDGGSTNSSETHPVLLAISSYAKSKQKATVTVTKGESTLLD
ncbi:hypothetical protein [Haladaptatus sp. DFWS20]|uniref:hypothetical protein n=1 Tax=Haladaptatus sp. DFWS20 TaxID=3403467 RepID=UPI003EBDE24B